MVLGSIKDFESTNLTGRNMWQVMTPYVDVRLLDGRS